MPACPVDRLGRGRRRRLQRCPYLSRRVEHRFKKTVDRRAQHDRGAEAECGRCRTRKDPGVLIRQPLPFAIVLFPGGANSNRVPVELLERWTVTNLANRLTALLTTANDVVVERNQLQPGSSRTVFSAICAEDSSSTRSRCRGAPNTQPMREFTNRWARYARGSAR